MLSQLKLLGIYQRELSKNHGCAGAALEAVAEAAVKDEREAIDTLVDEECAKLQTDDKSLDYWHGVGAAVTAMENAIRARGEKAV